MQHVETITINRPVAVIWELVGKPSNWDRWMQGLSNAQIDGEMRPGAGLSYTWNGKERKTTVTRYINNQEIAIHGEEPNYSYTELIIVRGMGTMTSVSMSMVFEPKVWWTAALTPFMFAVKKVGMGRPIRRSLNALRREVEKASSTVAA